MMQHIGGDLKDVVVFGDDTNDMVMFDPQWTSVAMGNACQELKAIATLVTNANVDDGIYNICKKMEIVQSSYILIHIPDPDHKLLR